MSATALPLPTDIRRETEFSIMPGAGRDKLATAANLSGAYRLLSEPARDFLEVTPDEIADASPEAFEAFHGETFAELDELGEELKNELPLARCVEIKRRTLHLANLWSVATLTVERRLGGALNELEKRFGPQDWNTFIPALQQAADIRIAELVLAQTKPVAIGAEQEGKKV